MRSRIEPADSDWRPLTAAAARRTAGRTRIRWPLGSRPECSARGRHDGSCKEAAASVSRPRAVLPFAPDGSCLLARGSHGPSPLFNRRSNSTVRASLHEPSSRAAMGRLTTWQRRRGPIRAVRKRPWTSNRPQRFGERFGCSGRSSEARGFDSMSDLSNRSSIEAPGFHRTCVLPGFDRTCVRVNPTVQASTRAAIISES